MKTDEYAVSKMEPEARRFFSDFERMLRDTMAACDGTMSDEDFERLLKLLREIGSIASAAVAHMVAAMLVGRWEHEGNSLKDLPANIGDSYLELVTEDVRARFDALLDLARGGPAPETEEPEEPDDVQALEIGTCQDGCCVFFKVSDGEDAVRAFMPPGTARHLADRLRLMADQVDANEVRTAGRLV